jgi:hypothetical protein
MSAQSLTTQKERNSEVTLVEDTINATWQWSEDTHVVQKNHKSGPPTEPCQGI